jgi:hypothetical protein
LEKGSQVDIILLDLFEILEPNFDGIIIEWSSSKIVSGSRAFPPRWPPQCSCVVVESSFVTTEQKFIHSFCNALRIRRKINQLHQRF